jgi:hypothetical protein
MQGLDGVCTGSKMSLMSLYACMQAATRQCGPTVDCALWAVWGWMQAAMRLRRLQCDSAGPLWGCMQAVMLY